ncbi:AcrR family transcriptional regulator [Luteibacter sp. HA06]|jgi:AcrR family transcriptional regulator
MTDAITTPEATPTGAPGIREQIVEAADAHFSRYGYAKTTVADLAKAIGFSKAYIYKFFDSKQAIGEAICWRCLSAQLATITEAVEAAQGAHEKLRVLFRTAVEENRAQFFEDRQLYDIVTYSCAENWASSTTYVVEFEALLASIIREGRESGEFERKTPADEVLRAICLATSPFTHPLLLQHNLDQIEHGLPAVTSLVLRSLAP